MFLVVMLCCCNMQANARQLRDEINGAMTAETWKRNGKQQKL